MQRELEGRVALVTGAGRNIGAAIARDLAACGAAVVVNARSNRDEAEAVAQSIRGAGGRAAVTLGDVVDQAAAAAMVRTALESFGRLDILVNNAAIRREVPFEEMDFAAWRAILDVCLDGAFHVTKAALAALKASGAGAIINIGGLTGHTGAPHRAHVVTAKAGLAGFTRALAHDLAADGITVNLVAPGMIDTTRGPGGSATPHAPGHRAGRKTLVGREGTSEEVAAAVRYLAGPGARYVTGQSIHVNGGAFLAG
ncbi:3-oxoacyl-ACP reductase FabG [Elioraea rosea]|uniref:3-oxoacyl-ACP reductase FabG n=1 Tax=Elioraea rosea TaxID=2492390 RepID=UPI001182EF96|nr:3-oxoacyl-ACP reductase FabG [Elioraea rosea]